jgi:hypothetical protein
LTNLFPFIEYAKRKGNKLIFKCSIIPKHYM